MAVRVRLAVFDLAGTIVDHGCLAPMRAFIDAYAASGVTVTPEQVRDKMGIHKREQIARLAALPAVAEQWRAKHGRDLTEQDVDEIYETQFVPRQLDAIARHSDLIPGLLPCLRELRSRGLKVAATTGYFREAAERVYEAARRQGFAIDHAVCAEEVPAGRPAPWMIYRNMEALGVYPAAAVVKVGDTVADVGEALNAGCWAVGVTRTGSLVGCTAAEFETLNEEDRRVKLDAAEEKLAAAGAHFVIESAADLPAVVDELDDRLRDGMQP